MRPQILAKIIRNDLHTSIEKATCCHGVWWRLVGEHERREVRMPAVRNYESFFEQTIIINYTSFVFAICNIYDSSAQALSINRLRRLVPDNPNVKGVNYKDIDARLRKARKIADKLRKVRNTRIAHRLEQMLHENAYDEIKLLYNDLSDLIADTKSAFIDLSFHVDEWVPQFSTEVEDDLERLMDALVNYHGTKLMNAA